MPGIDLEIVTHKLNVCEGVKPVKQKKRNFGPEKDKIIEEEVQKLLDAGFIEECLHPRVAGKCCFGEKIPTWEMEDVYRLKDLPLEKILEKIERSSRLAKWVVELNGLGVKYQPRKVIKGQVLADIFAEWTTQDESEEPIWQLLTDGSSRLVCIGAGLQ